MEALVSFHPQHCQFQRMDTHAKGRKVVEPPTMDGKYGEDSYDVVDEVAASMIKAKGRLDL